MSTQPNKLPELVIAVKPNASLAFPFVVGVAAPDYFKPFAWCKNEEDAKAVATSMTLAKALALGRVTPDKPKRAAGLKILAVNASHVWISDLGGEARVDSDPVGAVAMILNVYPKRRIIYEHPELGFVEMVWAADKFLGYGPIDEETKSYFAPGAPINTRDN